MEAPMISPTKTFLIVLAILALPLIALADSHFDAKKRDVISAEEQQLAAELTEFLTEYAAVYNEQNYRAVKQM
jgi:hypothetical protein